MSDWEQLYIRETKALKARIAELEKQRDDYKHWNMERYHIMHSVADELQGLLDNDEYNYVGDIEYDLRDIIKRLRGA